MDKSWPNELFRRVFVIPAIALGVIMVTFATLGRCGDGCGLIGNFILLQHYLLHSQALTLSYSAVGFVALGSYLMQNPSQKLQHYSIDSDDDAFVFLLQILKEDERKVLVALANAGGSATQREISRRTDLSRLKTHRVVMRLQERRVVNAERHGRTSLVTLQSWLCKAKDN